MDNTDPKPDALAPIFHEASESVRFWVPSGDGRYIAASIRRDTMRHVFGSTDVRSEPVALYLAHQGEIQAAVLRRCAAGSYEPVLLREPDLARQRP